MIQPEPKWITFHILSNDFTKANAYTLMLFKEIIAKALPNMDRVHIIRLIMDPRHQSLLIRENHQIIGGVCYRVNMEASFAEIAFLAIKHERRIQGFGQKVIDRLKHEMQGRKIQYMLTYGDMMALGFFRKQGFSQKLTFPRSKWQGYIKEYDGGKLMQCKIYPKVNYLQINDIIKKQKRFLEEKIKSMSLNHIQFEGKMIPQGKSLIRKKQQQEEEEFKVDPRLVPGLREGGWQFKQHDELLMYEQQPFKKRCWDLLEKIAKYPEASQFKQAVSKKKSPEYYKHIKNPIDLKVIGLKIKQNQYKNQQHFCQDIHLMLENCKQFNHPITQYYRNAVSLEKMIHPSLEAFRNGIIETGK